MITASSDIVGQEKSEYNLPYRSGDDRTKTLPLAPKSQEVTSPYMNGFIDIRWDNPAPYHENNNLEVVGCFVYRCFDTPFGNYVRVNSVPASTQTYRDATGEVLVVQEDVLAQLDPGNNPNNEWRFYTKNKPIVVPGSNGETANSFAFIKIEIDTGDGIWREEPAFKVDGSSGYVVLNKNKTYDAATGKFSDPVLPNLEMGGIRATYTYVNNLIDTGISKNVYYKVTTVAKDLSTNAIIETPLHEIEAKSLMDMEKVDYTWKEGIRRNQWLRDQGGERVKVFLRKWSGIKCSCTSEEFGRSKRTGIGTQQCLNCYGTGYVGGYEGPYDVSIEPPNTEKTVQLGEAGLKIQYNWTTWMGPEPLVKDRDVIVRANNERFVISNVNPVGSRGAIYQQHFSLDQLLTKDPIYSLPIKGGQDITPDGWNAYREGRTLDAQPTMAIKPGVIPENQIISRTVTFENIMS